MVSLGFVELSTFVVSVVNADVVVLSLPVVWVVCSTVLEVTNSVRVTMDPSEVVNWLYVVLSLGFLVLSAAVVSVVCPGVLEVAYSVGVGVVASVLDDW